MVIRSVTVIFSALLAGCTTSIPPAGTPTSVHGVVRVEGIGTHTGTNITVQGPVGPTTATTDVEGNFALTVPAPGSYTLTVTRPKYFPEVRQIQVDVAGATLEPIRIKNHRLLVPFSAYDASRAQIAPTMMSGPVAITRAWTSNLALSPDGTRLGYIDGGTIKSTLLDGTGGRLEADIALASGERAEWFDWGKAGILVQRSNGASVSLGIIAQGSTRTLMSVPANQVFSPAWSPDGTQIAYYRFDPGSKRPYLAKVNADGSGKQDYFDIQSRLNYLWTPDSYGLMFTPVTWSSRGILFHAPMTCQLDTTNARADGIYVFDPKADPKSSAAVQKIHTYSFYEHTFSSDNSKVLVGSHLTLVSKDLASPQFFVATTPTGYFSDETYSSLIAAPDGQRIFFLSTAGIEEMNLL